MADGDLSPRGGELSAHFVAQVSKEVFDEPILLGRVADQNGNYVNYVHEVSGLLGGNRDINTYNDREFFTKFGDPSQMVTLAEYNAELEGINPGRDAAMHKAADIYNNAVQYGMAEGAVEYSGTLNFGDLERELERKIQEYDLPKAVEKQIDSLIDESRKLSATGSTMLSRFNKIEAEVAANGLSGHEFDGIQGETRSFSRDGLIETGKIAVPTQDLVH